MALTTAAKNALLVDHHDTTVYYGLSTTVPNATGGNFTEPTIGVNGYARKQIDTGDWDTPASGESANTAEEAFPAASGGNWGTILAIGRFSAATGGVPDVVKQLTSSVVVNDGSTFKFAAGALKDLVGGTI